MLVCLETFLPHIWTVFNKNSHTSVKSAAEIDKDKYQIIQENALHKYLGAEYCIVLITTIDTLTDISLSV